MFLYSENNLISLRGRSEWIVGIYRASYILISSGRKWKRRRNFLKMEEVSLLAVK